MGKKAQKNRIKIQENRKRKGEEKGEKKVCELMC